MGRLRIMAALALAAQVFGACSAAATPAESPAGAPGASASSGAPASPGRVPTVPPGRFDSMPPGWSPGPVVPDAGVTGEVPAELVEKARALLQETVGAAAARATVVISQEVTWPDGSMGCPEPGMFYTQAQVRGFQVVFDLDGTRHDYRITPGGNVRICEPRSPRGS
jgi:hypothetical protein